MNKYIITFAALITVGLFFSCSDSFLDEDENTFLSPGNIYRTEAGLEGALVPLYRSVNEYMGSRVWPQGGIDIAQTTFNSRADNVALDTYNSQLNGEIGAVKGWWSTCYQSIERTNQIIYYGQDAKFESEDSKMQILGEAYFFRAFFYFEAMQTWGDIPLVLYPASVPRDDFERTSRDSIIPHVISDLKIAIQGINDRPAMQGKLTKGAARHLLSNVYLYAEDWLNAELQADSLINLGVHKLVTERFGIEKDSVGTPFTDIFLQGNENIEDGNTEAMFVIQFDNRINKDIVKINTIKFAWQPSYEKVIGLKLSNDNYQRGKWRASMTPYWFSLFEDGDDRNSDFAIKRKYYYNDCKVIDEMLASGNPIIQWVSGIPMLVKCGDEVIITEDDPMYPYVYPTPMKFMGIMGDDPSESSVDKDIIMYRLAETYLFKAEAQFRQDNFAGAAETINIIRQRANASEVEAADITLDFILEERAREMGAEVNRWATLVRTGKLLEYYEKARPDDATSIQDYHTLMPIPQSEIDLNTNSVNFKQNTGYPGS